MKVRGSGLSLFWSHHAHALAPRCLQQGGELLHRGLVGVLLRGSGTRADRPTSTARFFFSVLFSVIESSKWDYPVCQEAVLALRPLFPQRLHDLPDIHGMVVLLRITSVLQASWGMACGVHLLAHSACGTPAPAPPAQNRGRRTRPAATVKPHSFTLSTSRPLLLPHRDRALRYSSPKKARVKYSSRSTNSLVYRWGRI